MLQVIHLAASSVFIAALSFPLFLFIVLASRLVSGKWRWRLMGIPASLLGLSMLTLFSLSLLLSYSSTVRESLASSISHTVGFDVERRLRARLGVNLDRASTVLLKQNEIVTMLEASADSDEGEAGFFFYNNAPFGVSITELDRGAFQSIGLNEKDILVSINEKQIGRAIDPTLIKSKASDSQRRAVYQNVLKLLKREAAQMPQVKITYFRQ